MVDNDLLTILGMLGQTGAGMLKGTDKEWVGAPGAVAANVAKNTQAGLTNKDFMDALRAINNPNVSKAGVTIKPDGTMAFSLGGNAIDPAMPDWTQAQIAPRGGKAATPTTTAPSTVAATSSAPLNSALTPSAPPSYMDDTQRAMMSSMLAQGGGPSPFPWARSLWQYRG